jgi:ferrous-iron efflux pump FieF
MNSDLSSNNLDIKRTRLLKQATYASVFVAVLLIVVKMLAWLVTGSMSILASLVDSLMDSVASIINLLAVRYALMPADHEHRFGHGKAEPLAALTQAAFICGSAIFLILHAIDNLRFANTLQELDFGIAVMVFATVVTGVLVLFQFKVIRLTQSTAIRADALHYSMDLLTNIATIVALVLTYLGWERSDSIFAIGLAIYIFYNAVVIGHDAFQQLMDRELGDDIQQRLESIALAHPEVCGVHDLRSRQSGQLKFVQLHLELDDVLSLLEAHTIADQVEEAICEVFTDTEVIIHLDPASIRDTKK